MEAVAVQARAGRIRPVTARPLPWRAGLLGPARAPVGAWLAKDLFEREDDAPSQVKVWACWRTPGGRAVGAYADGMVRQRDAGKLAEDAHAGGVEGLVPANGRIRQAFGTVVAAMREAAGLCPMHGHLGGDPAPWAECGATLDAFLRTLDREALEWAEERSLLGLVGDAWHLMDGTFGNGVPLRACVDAWPWSRRMVLDLWERHPDAAPAMGPHDVHAWISDRLAGPPHRYPRHVARRHADAARWATALVEGGGDDAAVANMPSPLDAMRPLAWLPPSWVPRDRDWMAYIRLSPSLSRLGTYLGAAGSRSHMARLFDAGGRWDDLEDRLCRAAAVSRDGTYRALGDIHDVSRAFSEAVVQPATAGHGLPSTVTDTLAFHAVTGSRNMCAALRTSRAWHSAVPSMHAFLEGLPGCRAVTEWDPVLPRMRLGDMEVVPLADAASLRAEGARDRDADGMEGLDHCVGTSAGNCSRNLTRILSIRRRVPGGRAARSSTAEVAVDGAGTRLVVTQHRGRSNADPAAADRETLSGYMAGVAATFDPARGLGPVTPAQRDEGAAGYDTSWPGNLSAVSGWWKRFLAPPYRGLGTDDWARVAKAPHP